MYMDKKYDYSNAIHMRNYVYNIHCHLVWATKYRNKVFITPKLVQGMEKLLKYIAKCNEVAVENIKVMPDHVHMLVSFRPKLSITTMVRTLKGNSARYFLLNHPKLRKKLFWGNHLWSHSYYVGTVGDMSRQTVEKYIDDRYQNSPYPDLDKRKRK